MTQKYRRINNSRPASKGEDPVAGFTLQDEKMLRDTHPRNDPKTQVFLGDDMVGLDQEEVPTTRVCQTCDSYNMKYWPSIGFYFCHTCGAKVDSDKGYQPTTASEEDDMYLPVSQIQYATVRDADLDHNNPFFWSWNPDKEHEDGNGFEITYQSADKRIEHRKATTPEGLLQALKD